MKTMITAAVLLAVSAVGARAQDVGVASCDKFLKTFDACVTSKAAPAQKDALVKARDAMKSNWVGVAKTADGKKNLESVCDQTASQMKQQLAALQCSW